MKKSTKTIVTLSAASLLLGATSLTSTSNANADELSYGNLGSGARVRSSLLQSQHNNPFGVLMGEDKTGEEGKCGEGKCGEGKCGEGTKDGEKGSGEAKCGSGEGGDGE